VTRGIRLVTAVALTAFACAAAAADAVAPVVYDATQLAFGRYVLVKRLGIDGWRSAFNIPGHPDLASAMQAVLSDAARARADGVINLKCFDQTDAVFNPAGYFCYADAIRLKK
jgi:hypothetical protein